MIRVASCVEQIMTDSDMVDLYEEMLCAKAMNRIRPVLYVSSSKDLECSVLMLLNAAPELRLAGRQRSFASGFRQHVRTM
jgi:hypothetical protein